MTSLRHPFALISRFNKGLGHHQKSHLRCLRPPPGRESSAPHLWAHQWFGKRRDLPPSADRRGHAVRHRSPTARHCALRPSLANLQVRAQLRADAVLGSMFVRSFRLLLLNILSFYWTFSSFSVMLRFSVCAAVSSARASLMSLARLFDHFLNSLFDLFLSVRVTSRHQVRAR